MKNKTGFTLVELLTVLTIFGILCIFAIPLILNQVKNNQKEISKTQEKIIFHATYLYLGENIMPNSTYCVKIQDLLDDDLLEEPVKDFETGKVLSSDRIVKATTDNKKKVSYILLDKGASCTPVSGKPTPPVEGPKSFATDSWNVIANAVKNGNTDVYKVGDTKEVTLTGEVAGTYTVRLANNSNPTECSGADFSQTACGFVVEFVDIISRHKMNVTGTNVGGWPASEMRSYVNNTIYNALPADLKSVITNTKVVSSHGNSSGETNFTSTDRLYLLSTKEVWNGGITTDTTESETRQLDYYNNNGVTTSNVSEAIKQYNGSNLFWWLRSATLYISDNFFTVDSNGDWNDYNAASTYGVAPAFRIG